MAPFEPLNRTARPTVLGLEALLGQELPVLDKGYVRPLDYMGNDAEIAAAARVSYGKGTRKIRDDRSLIRYLMRHGHTSPFEMAEIRLEFKLPIFVARQIVRTRTANLNEVSARFSILDEDYYVPELEALAPQSPNNKQGRADEPFGPMEALQCQATIREASEKAWAHYRLLLNEDNRGEPIDKRRAGLARELARLVLPVNAYTRWVWKIDLHNLFRFLRQRLDDHAQRETRAYAACIAQLVETWVPLAWEAFCDYQLHAVTFSAQELAAVRRWLLHGEAPARETCGLSEREWKEFQAKLYEPAKAA